MRHGRIHELCVVAGVLGTLLLTVAPMRGHGADADPFAFLSPWIVISDADRQRVDRDEVIVRILPGRDREIGALATTRLNAPPEALAMWTRSILDLRRSTHVKAIGRISDPPVLADLAPLALDEDDVDALRECVPGDCRLRMSDAEIRSLQPIMRPGRPEWRQAVQRRFREIVLGVWSAPR